MRTSSDRPDLRRRLRRVLEPLAPAIVACILVGHGGVAIAGTLEIYESSASPGVPRIIASPVTDELLDFDYQPTTAEGNGLYGLSEIRFATTGDLAFTSAGFWCPAVSCLYAPLPFNGGTEIVVTAGISRLTDGQQVRLLAAR